MTLEEIIIELNKDLYTLRKAYQEEQTDTKRYRGWWQDAQTKLDEMNEKHLTKAN